MINKLNDITHSHISCSQLLRKLYYICPLLSFICSYTFTFCNNYSQSLCLPALTLYNSNDTLLSSQVWLLLLLLGSVLTAAEKKTVKQEAKSLPTSPPTEEQQESNTQNTTELKPGKRGAHGEEENLGQFKEDSKGVGQTDLTTAVAHHNPIVPEEVVYMHVPVPHPYAVEYFKDLPYPVKVPVPLVVHKPFPVPVPSHFHFTVEKKVPFPVVKHVPIHVKTPAELSDWVPVVVPVPELYTTPVSKTIPLPVPHSDIRHIPVYISQHPESQEIHKLKVNKASQHEESAPKSQVSTPQYNYYVKISNIPETRLPETYKVFIPGANYQHLTLPETHLHHNLAQYQQSSTPEAFHHETKSPGLSSYELSTFGGHEAVFVDIVYLSHGQAAEGHGFGYQSVNTHWPKYHSISV